MNSDSKQAQGEPRFFRCRDLVIIGILVAVALTWLIFVRRVPADLTTQAVIVIDQVEVGRVDLVEGQAEDFSFEACPAVLFHRYDDGSFAFVESDCPDKICINTGRLKQPYHYAACLPNLVVVTIEPFENTDTSEEEIDFVY